MNYILSLGTNMGDRLDNLQKAVDAINSVPYTDVTACSGVYETEPVGYARQQNFYNMVISVDSRFDMHEMLGMCLGIEAGFGRVRAIRNGPRILDIDIIFAENNTANTDNLIIPHPRYHERRFVLEPLLDLFPDGVYCSVDFKKFIEPIEGQAIMKTQFNIDF